MKKDSMIAQGREPMLGAGSRAYRWIGAEAHGLPTVERVSATHSEDGGVVTVRIGGTAEGPPAIGLRVSVPGIVHWMAFAE